MEIDLRLPHTYLCTAHTTALAATSPIEINLDLGLYFNPFLFHQEVSSCLDFKREWGRTEIVIDGVNDTLTYCNVWTVIGVHDCQSNMMLLPASLFRDSIFL